MAVRRREDLVLGEAGHEQVRLADALDAKLRKLFGRSLRLRQVSAGGCGACEACPAHRLQSHLRDTYMVGDPPPSTGHHAQGSTNHYCGPT